MPVQVPTMDEFNALAARVTVLEQGSTQPPGPTPDGTYITAPGAGVIRDDAGNEYTLVDSKGADQLKIAKNGKTDAVTRHVVTLGIEQRHCVQKNAEGNWYQDNNNASKTDVCSWQQIGGPQPGPSPNPGSLYHVSNGRIYAPNGKDFRFRGPNLRFLNWPDNHNVTMGSAISNKSACTPLVTTFPGLTAVRFDAFESMAQLGDAQLSAIQPFIDSIIAKGIVCEVECHVYPMLLTGDNLNRVCEWYKTVARHYKGVPEVIFGTQNEPDGNPDEGIDRIYDAIRGEGNDTLILMCPRGGWDFGPLNRDKRKYKNVAWDYHWYGWMSQFNRDQNYVDSRLLQVWNDSNQFQSADGVIPMVIGEFGPCGYNDTNGGSFYKEFQYYMDQNWEQNIVAVYKAPFTNGGMQWVWNAPETSQTNTIDNLIMPDGNYNGSRVTDPGGTHCQRWCRGEWL